MSEVLKFKRPSPPNGQPPTLDDIFGDDASYLRFVGQWRAARAQQQKNWAEHDVAAGRGTLPSAQLARPDLSPLERMRELERHLAEVKPHTMLLVYELLGMCATILAYEHPKDELARGPVLDIVRNVMSSLGSCKPEMRIRRASAE
jgi:hypothetical protein